MNARAFVLREIRQALQRAPGDAVAELPEVRLRPASIANRAALFRERLETLLGTVQRSTFANAAAEVNRLVAGRSYVTSASPLLARLGLSQCADRANLQNVCASVDVGITSAAYGLAATGSLVMLSSATEARMISLLPPVHIAVIETSQILADIDELFTVLPDPARQTSSMVLITGPSRTGDIEQISIRGVHGPGELHVVLIDR